MIRSKCVRSICADALVAMLDRLGLEPIVYKRAGEMLEQEIDRRLFGDSSGEDAEAWNLENDAPAPIDASTRLVVAESHA